MRKFDKKTNEALIHTSIYPPRDNKTVPRTRIFRFFRFFSLFFSTHSLRHTMHDCNFISSNYCIFFENTHEYAHVFWAYVCRFGLIEQHLDHVAWICIRYCIHSLKSCYLRWTLRLESDTNIFSCYFLQWCTLHTHLTRFVCSQIARCHTFLAIFVCMKQVLFVVHPILCIFCVCVCSS